LGGDGAGGIYFIDTKRSDSFIYYIDHDDPPKNICDTDHISSQTLTEFKNDLITDKEEYERHCREVRERISHRKWWQFWIPKQIPLWAKEKSDE
jgi:hypothetical protein